MLCMYVMDKSSKREDYLHLVEFAYYNGHHTSLTMSQFEDLYERKCRTLVSWNNIVNIIVLGIEMPKEMEQELAKIK